MYRGIEKNLTRDPFSTATAILVGSGILGGSQVISSIAENKSAKEAARAQENVAAMQLQAVKDSELSAQKTAEEQRRAAIARKSNTILTTPLGSSTDNSQINKQTLLGAV